MAHHLPHLTISYQPSRNGKTFLFLHSFEDITDSISYFSGVGAMEVVAMDMKLRGMYIARQLSFHGVTFKIEEVTLTKKFEKVYDDSVVLVSAILFYFYVIAK